MKLVICSTTRRTADLANTLTNVLRSLVDQIELTVLDVTALFSNPHLEWSYFGTFDACIVCVNAEMWADSLQSYGIANFANNLASVVTVVCLCGMTQSNAIPSGVSSRFPFFTCDVESVRHLVKFLDATSNQGAPNPGTLRDRFDRRAMQWDESIWRPTTGPRRISNPRQQLMKLIESPAGESLSSFILQMLELLSKDWAAFDGRAMPNRNEAFNVQVQQNATTSMRISQSVVGRARPIRVFVSYSHGDEMLRNELNNHLSSIKRNNLIESWHDRCIRPGEDFEHEIETQLESADLILLLISARFLASEYCYKKEMLRAMERHREGVARVVPIIVRPVEWRDTPIGQLLALPKDGRAVVTWQNRDAAWADIAKQIREIATELAS